MAEQPAAITPTRLAIRGWPHADRLAARVIPGGLSVNASIYSPNHRTADAASVRARAKRGQGATSSA
jgi:hypothetical protein